MDLFEAQAKIIGDLEARLQVLEDQIAKNSQRVLDVLYQAFTGTPYSPCFIFYKAPK